MQLDNGTQNIIAGAVIDFLAYLTCLPKTLVVGSSQTPLDAMGELEKWAFLRGLDMESAQVQDWDKSPENPTLQMLASSGQDQSSKISGALRDFATYCGTQDSRDWEPIMLRWATKKELSMANPQVFWNFRQWG
jgi:hypothetical protein